VGKGGVRPIRGRAVRPGQPGQLGVITFGQLPPESFQGFFTPVQNPPMLNTAKAGQAIPQTWAVKADGSPTTNAAEAIAGMLLPAAGPKGFALSFLIDLMCGLLSGGATGAAVQPLYGTAEVPYDCSHLFIAIDTAHFGNPASFRKLATEAAERIRNGKRAAGVEQLYAPGEPEWRRRQAAAGNVNLAPAVAAMLARLAEELGVSLAPLELHGKETGYAKA